MSKTDIEEVAFDATNRIKRMISETAPKDSVQLGEFILSVITEALVDTVTASCEQLVEENTRMRTAIDQTIAWQQSVDASNIESVRPLLELLDKLGLLNQESQSKNLNSAAANKELTESAAKAIYDGWQNQPGWLPWVDGGNSEKQEESRRLARKAIEGGA